MLNYYESGGKRCEYWFIRRFFMAICFLMYSLTTSVVTVRFKTTLHVLRLIYTYIELTLPLVREIFATKAELSGIASPMILTPLAQLISLKKT